MKYFGVTTKTKCIQQSCLLISLSDLLCLRSCTAMAGLLLHSMANMRTTITNVLVLMTGGVIISYVEKKNRKHDIK